MIQIGNREEVEVEEVEQTGSTERNKEARSIERRTNKGMRNMTIRAKARILGSSLSTVKVN